MPPGSPTPHTAYRYSFAPLIEAKQPAPDTVGKVQPIGITDLIDESSDRQGGYVSVSVSLSLSYSCRSPFLCVPIPGAHPSGKAQIHSPGAAALPSHPVYSAASVRCLFYHFLPFCPIPPVISLRNLVYHSNSILITLL